MENMSSSSSFSVSQQASACDEIPMEQSLIFSDSLKDLQSLRTQLYSAAEYFEVSYANDDQKQIVANTLKDYAVQAIINTIDHLGSASYRVVGFLDEKVDEVTENELRVSCVEQRLHTCKVYNDRQGLSEQSLWIRTPKYHKRYILPVEGSVSGSAQTQAKKENDEVKQLKRDNATQETALDPSLSVRKACASSQPPFSTDKRSASPAPNLRLSRSGSLSSRPNTPSPSNSQKPATLKSQQIGRPTTPNFHRPRWYPSEPQRSASMRLPSEKEGQKEMIDQYPSKSKRLLKSLLGRHKSKNNSMTYSYLDEY